MLTTSIKRNESMCMDARKSCMDPIKAYLKTESLLKDRKEAKKVKKWLSHFFYNVIKVSKQNIIQFFQKSIKIILSIDYSC